jgi:hypothetical protein
MFLPAFKMHHMQQHKPGTHLTLVHIDVGLVGGSSSSSSSSSMSCAGQFMLLGKQQDCPACNAPIAS